MISFPNAKINLGLNVLSRRNDGFHNISTIMVPVGFHDILELLPGDGSEDIFYQTGLSLPGEMQENLCLKASKLFRETYGGTGLRIHLHKMIPAGTGLGGGSSDAARTLIMMDELFGSALKEEELEMLASRLGSDCSFFIGNRPALAAGRGDVLTPVDVDLSGKEILILLPEIHISTPWAYSKVTPGSHPVPPQEVVLKDISEWKGLLVNDFEKPVFEEYPLLKDLRDRLYEAGAIYASVSGSGSAIYGIFDDIPDGIGPEFAGIQAIKTLITKY
jgi:4-diphosphocytidyl-2-C-methyl-D-erythritol kinase